jgi:hypothetical protein
MVSLSVAESRKNPDLARRIVMRAAVLGKVAVGYCGMGWRFCQVIPDARQRDRESKGRDPSSFLTTRRETDS